MTQHCTIGIDWGSTHRRSYVFDAQGKCIASHTDAMGALACSGQFEAALQDLLTLLDTKPTRVTLSGMVGSTLGWKEIPYLPESVPLWELKNHLAPVHGNDSQLAISIVPGYCVRGMDGRPDVMRGEETQLLGALLMGHPSGWFVLPGTHSKWVLLNKGRIVQLKTFMTGELFQLLSRHGSIAKHCIETDEFAQDIFIDAVKTAQQGALSHLLFLCRSRVVCADMPASATMDYLSGILIGSEMRGLTELRPLFNFFHIIGEPGLAARYQLAAQVLQLDCASIDAIQSYCAAMGYFSLEASSDAH